MILFTASSACILYLRFNAILPGYGMVLLPVGFVVTLGSQLLTFLLIKLLGRRSIIVYMMLLLMSAACVIMFARTSIVTRELIAHPEELWDFGSLCPAGNPSLP
jgi:hypothetical protein